MFWPCLRRCVTAFPWAAVAAAAAFPAPAARADATFGGRDHDPQAEFAVGIGYTRIDFDGDDSLLEGRDGIHLNPVLSFAPFADVPQLRLGGAVGWSVALDEARGQAVSDDGGLFVATSSDVTLMLFEPELRLSWRQPLDRGENIFIEPGVAAGAVVGWLDIGDEEDDTPDVADANAFSETDAAFQWKVFVRAGMRVQGGLAGIEASYMWAEALQFADNLGGQPGEFYFGIFGALRF